MEHKCSSSEMHNTLTVPWMHKKSLLYMTIFIKKILYTGSITLVVKMPSTIDSHKFNLMKSCEFKTLVKRENI